ncbi:sigma-70 family RNA polymerase sigma factor [Clostridium thermarum]|uniref:sigma-70 family RNA polymerase sigma factor n=1 Tax=Clostridium thermarum TaxID=1716543 RepID=UPI0013D8414E|nr:sigma-70 family RNA polymerase sigma factor [Clostridium thermarum]
MDKEYHITLNGKLIPVTEEVYYAFKRPAWKERKRRQARAEKELSLEAFADAGFEIPSGQALVDEIVEDKLLLDMLSKALLELTDNERFLIDELFYNGKSERELSKETCVPRKTLAYRRTKVLEKLRRLIEKM